MLASVEPDAIYFRSVPQFFCVGVLQREVPVVADWMSCKFGGGCFGSLRSGFDFGRYFNRKWRGFLRLKKAIDVITSLVRKLHLLKSRAVLVY